MLDTNDRSHHERDPCLLPFICLERSQVQLWTRSLSVEQSLRAQMSKWPFSLLALKAAVHRMGTLNK